MFLKGKIERKDIDFNIHLSSNPLGILPVMHDGAEVFKMIALVGVRIGCGSISGGQLGNIEQIEDVQSFNPTVLPLTSAKNNGFGFMEKIPPLEY